MAVRLVPMLFFLMQACAIASIPDTCDGNTPGFCPQSDNADVSGLLQSRTEVFTTVAGSASSDDVLDDEVSVDDKEDSHDDSDALLQDGKDSGDNEEEASDDIPDALVEDTIYASTVDDTDEATIDTTRECNSFNTQAHCDASGCEWSGASCKEDADSDLLLQDDEVSVDGKEDSHDDSDALLQDGEDSVDDEEDSHDDSDALLQDGDDSSVNENEASKDILDALSEDEEDPDYTGETKRKCLSFKTKVHCDASGCAWKGNLCGHDETNIKCDTFKTKDHCDTSGCKWSGDSCEEDSNDMPPAGALLESRGCRRRRAHRRRSGGCPYCRRRRAPARRRAPSVSATATYYETAYGSSTCPTGFKKVIDKAECLKAKSALKKTSRMQVQAWGTIQGGCFSGSYAGGKHIWFNTASTSRTHGSYSSICKRVAPAPTKAPTTAPTPATKGSSSAKTSDVFDRIDSDKDKGITSAELKKAMDAGTIKKGTIFDRIDADNTKGISRAELQKALADGKIKDPAAKARAATAAPPAPSPSQGPKGPLTQAQMDTIVKKHNELRAGMGASDMTMMVWDNTLAAAAQQWVTGGSLLSGEDVANLTAACPSGHSNNRQGAGENIAWKWASNLKLTATTDFSPSIQSWYDEIKDSGNYKSGGTFDGFGPCPGVCGHYTQVVWAAANKIGCGAAYCPAHGMGGYELVCQYGSSVAGGHGGNMGGATLFTKGTACSKCPSGFGTCSNKLCTAR